MRNVKPFFLRQKDRPDPGLLSTQAFANLANSLSDIMRLQAELAGAFYCDHGWKFDPENPGYVIRSGGGVKVSIPYFLVSIFPSSDVLTEIWELSRRIKTAPESTICLSGSTTGYRTLKSYADVDFCEYVPSSTKDLKQKLIDLTNRKAIPICTRLKIGDEHLFELTQKTLDPTKIQIDPNDKNYSHGRTDFIACLADKRFIDASNVMIFCDSSGSSAALSKTFAAQEAVLDFTATLPQKLDDPLEIGRYTLWLKSEVQKHLKDQKFMKALKRGLSLSRVTGLSETSDRLEAFAENSSAFIRSEIGAMRELAKRVDASADLQASVSKTDLEREILARSKELEAVEIRLGPDELNFEKVAASLLGTLLSDLDRITLGRAA